MRLSPHFGLGEFLSPRDRGRPSPAIIANLTKLASRVLEPLRADLDRPIRITSGWRSWGYNLSIGGAPNGQHPRGTAADIAVRDDDEALTVLAILSRNSHVGGLGYYPGRGFVHVDIRPRKKGAIKTWAQSGGIYRPMPQTIRQALLARGARDI